MFDWIESFFKTGYERRRERLRSNLRNTQAQLHYRIKAHEQASEAAKEEKQDSAAQKPQARKLPTCLTEADELLTEILTHGNLFPKKSEDKPLRRREGELAIEEGWRKLYAVRRLMMKDYNLYELKAEATNLRSESDKLSGWRKEAASNHLTSVDLKSDEIDEAALKLAVIKTATLVHEHYGNMWQKIGIRSENLATIAVLLFWVIVLIPFLGAFLLGESETTWWQFDRDTFRTLVMVELFGALGGILSVAFSLTSKSINERIPEQILGESFISWMRPMAGAAAAIAIYTFLSSDLLSEEIKNLMAGKEKSSEYGMLAIAFLSGFSERFFISTVDRITGKS